MGVFTVFGTTLSLSNCATLGNSSTTYAGGGIVNNATATLSNCNISNNTSNGPDIETGVSPSTDKGMGGGIDSPFGTTLTLTNCTLANNTASGDLGEGGGIYFDGTRDAFSGEITMTGCTLSGNVAGIEGGALDVGANVAVSLTNCTLANNSSAAVSTSHGGAINNYSASMTLTNCTFSGNISMNGGAINNGVEYVGQPGAVTLLNTILYGDTATTGSEIDNASGQASAANCDIQAGVPSGMTDNGGNISSDPLLSPFAENGGPTETMALGSGSQCYAAGKSNGAPTTDQRGESRPNPPSIGAYDRGAGHAFQSGIQMISVPASYGSESLATLFGYSSPVMAVWEPGAGTYSVIADSPCQLAGGRPGLLDTVPSIRDYHDVGDTTAHAIHDFASSRLEYDRLPTNRTSCGQLVDTDRFVGCIVHVCPGIVYIPSPIRRRQPGTGPAVHIPGGRHELRSRHRRSR